MPNHAEWPDYSWLTNSRQLPANTQECPTNRLHIADAENHWSNPGSWLSADRLQWEEVKQQRGELFPTMKPMIALLCTPPNVAGIKPQAFQTLPPVMFSAYMKWVCGRVDVNSEGLNEGLDENKVACPDTVSRSQGKRPDWIQLNIHTAYVENTKSSFSSLFRDFFSSLFKFLDEIAPKVIHWCQMLISRHKHTQKLKD